MDNSSPPSNTASISRFFVDFYFPLTDYGRTKGSSMRARNEKPDLIMMCLDYDTSVWRTLGANGVLRDFERLDGLFDFYTGKGNKNEPCGRREFSKSTN